MNKAVTFLSEGVYDGGAGHAPSSGGGPMALDDTLQGGSGRRALVELRRNSVCCFNAVLHLLNCCEHGLDGARWYSQSLQTQAEHRMNNAIITGFCVVCTDYSALACLTH